jgi:hypothetical protein
MTLEMELATTGKDLETWSRKGGEHDLPVGGESSELTLERRKRVNNSEIHHHVQVGAILEGSPQVDDERMLDRGEHALLIVGVFDLFHLYDTFLV